MAQLRRESLQQEKSRRRVFRNRMLLRPGLAKKVTIHLNEDTASRRDFLYNEIFSFLYQRGVAGATLLRPDAGFGAHHRMHQSDHGRAAAEHMPIRSSSSIHPKWWPT